MHEEMVNIPEVMNLFHLIALLVHRLKILFVEIIVEVIVINELLIHFEVHVAYLKFFLPLLKKESKKSPKKFFKFIYFVLIYTIKDHYELVSDKVLQHLMLILKNNLLLVLNEHLMNLMDVLYKIKAQLVYPFSVNIKIKRNMFIMLFTLE